MESSIGVFYIMRIVSDPNDDPEYYIDYLTNISEKFNPWSREYKLEGSFIFNNIFHDQIDVFQSLKKYKCESAPNRYRGDLKEIMNIIDYLAALQYQ